MLWNTENFNKEIRALKHLQKERLLHPLKKEQIKQMVLAQTAPETSLVMGRYSTQERRIKIMRYAISILVGLSLVGGTAFASSNAKPGDLLFPVKKAKEQIQLALAVNEQAKVQLQTKFAQERDEELTEVKAQVEEDQNKGESNDQHVQAQAQAETEVNHAISTLEEVRAKLEAKGNTTAAAAIGDTIVRLQANLSATSSTSTQVHIKGRDDEKNQNDNEQEDNKSTSTPSSVQGQINVNAHGRDNNNQTELDNNGQLELSH